MASIHEASTRLPGAPPPGEEWSLTARWLFPADAPPLPQGTITFRGDRITAVEPQGVRAADHDLGNVALVPGLVNAHTHLDLTGLRGQVSASPDFTAWLRLVISHRRQCEPQQTLEDVRNGIKEAISFGSTLLGDISVDGASLRALNNAQLRGVVFHEVLGLTHERATTAWNQARAWLTDATESESVHRGLSPHAPYSVGRWLFQQIAEKCNTLPVAIHIAETRDELELLASRSGFLVDFLKELYVWEPSSLAKSVDEIVALFVNCDKLLIVHGNYLAPHQVPRGATVIYCPRTHAAFGHGWHPFRDFLKAGVRVALGTDSLASNPDLDIFAEAQFVHQRYPDVSGANLLRTITLSGAEALGWSAEAGSLTPGKSADIVGIPLPDEDDQDPYHLLFGSPAEKRLVMFRGQWISTGETAT